MTISVYLILVVILSGIFVCGCFAAGPIFFMLGAPIFFILEAILYGIFVRSCYAAKSGQAAYKKLGINVEKKDEHTWVVRKTNCKKNE